MSINTSPAIPSWNPDTTHLPATEITPDALVLNPLVATVAATPQGDTASIRVPFIAADPTAQIVAEGDEIPEGDSTRAEIRVYTRKIALIQRISREAYGQQLAGTNATAGASDLLTESLRRAVTAKADAMLLNAPQESETVYVPGLANDTSDAMLDGGAITGNLDPLIDAIAAISDNGATPSCILVSNSGWAWLQRLKYTDGRPVVNPDVQADALPQLLGLPVVRNGAVPKDKLFVLDAANLIVGYSDVAVDVDPSAYFSSDSIGIRITARLGWGIPYRGRAARLTLGNTGEGTTTTTRTTRKTTTAKTGE